MMLVIQILGWILIALSTVFIIILFPPIRKKLREIKASGDGCKLVFADFYDKSLYWLVIVRQILLFLLPTGFLLVFSIKLEYVFSSLILGLSILIFVSLQLPSLMKANLFIVFRIDGEKQGSTINFRSGKTTYVEAQIQNLGFSTYKNFTIIFYFGGDFEIIPYDDPLYKELDFKKEFDVQKRYRGVSFNPKDNPLTIPPQEVFVFPMWVRVPNKEEEREMTILFYSENTWGKNTFTRHISITR